MKSYITSYNSLFTRRAPDAPAVDRIEIPIIQRDYAQGRSEPSVERIRENFLNVLHGALTNGNPISLDFVFGDVVSGTLRPLDGQQRLTTLFLLHWYLAWRADRLDQEQGWKNFSYATRASARRFCELLITRVPPTNVNNVSAWLKDQHWFMHTWQHDPTIQSMLVMLDSIHRCFVHDDCLAAWARLVAPAPAISFHLLPIEEIGLGKDLYIKMNSRGKPLTPFENFKAGFEQLLVESCPDRVKEFALKVDGDWADLLWPYRGIDKIVDDEFLRYFHFATELCEWQREGQLPVGDIELLGQHVYGPKNGKAGENLTFLFKCFDVWAGVRIAPFFAEVFALSPAPVDSADTGKVVLFGHANVDLFRACCESYGQTRGRNRVFSLAQTLFLYAVLLHRIYATGEFTRRLRMLRNLIEASSNEIRLESMPGLLADVRRLIIEGELEGITSFKQTQVAEERLKLDLLVREPTLASHLFHLEDHRILHGCLAAFELDAGVFERRGRAFHRVFSTEDSQLSLLTGALLAAGDYSRPLNHRFLQFGSVNNDNPWRILLAEIGRDDLAATRQPLGTLLDAVAEHQGDVRSALEFFTQRWLENAVPANGLDWRWYFVKYVQMREGSSGIYVGTAGVLGYSVCMLETRNMKGYHRDPYLCAIRGLSGNANTAVQGTEWLYRSDGPWFSGYETVEHCMRLKASGAEIQCTERGLLLKAPVAAQHVEAFSRVCAGHGVGTDLLLRVQQVDVNGRQLDTQDRIHLGAALLRDLIRAGL